MLYKKTNGGDVVIKIDIIKAFDTIYWDFLLYVFPRLYQLDS